MNRTELFISIPTLAIISISLFSSVCTLFGQHQISPLNYGMGKAVFGGAIITIIGYIIISFVITLLSPKKTK